MKMHSFALIGAITGVMFLSACGRASGEMDSRDASPAKLEVEDVFVQHVARFEELSSDVGHAVKVDDLIMHFGPMDKANQRALCRTRGSQTPEVIVDRNGWDQMDEMERESMVLHELGHCILRRKHMDGHLPDGVPTSLMNPYTMDSQTYESHEGHYRAELFKRKNEF